MTTTARTSLMVSLVAMLALGGCKPVLHEPPPVHPLPVHPPPVHPGVEPPEVRPPVEPPLVRPGGVHYPGSPVIGESVSDDAQRIGGNAISKARQVGKRLDSEGEILVKAYAKCRLCETIKSTLQDESVFDPQLDLDCASSSIKDRVVELVGFPAWVQILNDVSQLETELKKVSPERRLAYLRVDLACLR